MSSLVPQFESFYELSCRYLADNWKSEYCEGFVGIPAQYVKFRKFKNKSAKNNNKKYKYENGSYKYNNVGTVYYDDDCVKREFQCDGVNAFVHKKVANVRVATRPQRFSKVPEVATDFYHENEEFFLKGFPDFKLDEHVIVDGCYETNRHTIQQQIDSRNYVGSHLPSIESYSFIKTAVRDTIRKMQIKNLGHVSIDDIKDFDFDLDTQPGYRYMHYFNAQKKEDICDVAVKVAEERYKNILKATKSGRVIKREEIIPGIYTIGARNKREESPIACEECVSRAVHMPEWHTELHSGLFSDLITMHLVEKGEGPIFIGNSFIKCDRLDKQIRSSSFSLEGDWKKFDASLCNSLITAALCVLRLYFPPGLLYDNHFLAILDSLVIKDYHIVGGKVLRILHGVPSGSKLTSLIGSVINLIVLNYSFEDVKYHERSFAIGGDDFVAFIKNENLQKDRLIQNVTEKSAKVGMNLKFLKLREHRGSNNVADYPVFYKYTVFNGLPITPVDSLLERIFSPWNKKYRSNYDVLKFLDNVLPSLAFPSTSCLIFYKYYQYVYFRVTKQKLSINRIARSHLFMYECMIEHSVSHLDVKLEYRSKRNIYVNNIYLNKFIRDVFCISG